MSAIYQPSGPLHPAWVHQALNAPPRPSVIGLGSVPVIGPGSVSVIGPGSGQMTPPTNEPETTSLGLTVSRKFTINEALLDDEVIQYELLDEDGEVLLSGLSDDPVDAWLHIGIRVTEREDPGHPDR